MNSINAKKLEEYLSSLECPVCHKRTQFTITLGSNYRPCLKARPSCCCDYWRSCIQDIVAREATRIENCELTGTPYIVRV